MYERQYQLSEEAAKNPKIQELAHLIKEEAEENYYGDEPDIISFQTSYLLSENDGRAEKLITSDAFKQLSNIEKHEVIAALEIDETRTWGFGLADDPEALLVDVKVPRVRAAAHVTDALVLSGAIGHEVSGAESIQTLASEIEPDRHRRNMLLGGVVLHKLEGPQWLQLRYQSYDTLEHGDELGYRTWIGADFHGDFRTVRQTIFRSGAIDPLGRKQAFGPNQEVVVGAYHSIEPTILRALLEYQVVYAGYSKQQLFDTIVKKLEHAHATIHPNGPFDMPPFADFGQNNAAHDARLLQVTIDEDNNEIGRKLIDVPTGPGHALKIRFQLVAENDGVTFATTSEDASDSSTRFSLSKNEINEYITVLMSTEIGRTSRGALRNVLGALVTTDDLRKRLYN